MGIKELAIKTITKIVEELGVGIYVKVYNKKFETIRIGTDKKSATEDFLKQNKLRAIEAQKDPRIRRYVENNLFPGFRFGKLEEHLKKLVALGK